MASRPPRTLVVVDEEGPWLTLVVQCDRCFFELARERVDASRVTVTEVVPALMTALDAQDGQPLYRAVMGTTLGRLEREGVQRRDAKKCPPHPKQRQYWQPGDYATPDQLVCGRCFAVLAQRKYERAR